MRVAAWVCAVAIGLPSAGAGQMVEGSTTFLVHTDNGKTMTFVQTSKGHRVRNDMTTDQGNFSMIIDGEAGRMTMIMHQQRMYMRYGKTQLEQMGGAMSQYADQLKRLGDSLHQTRPEDPEAKVTNTGRTETVAGVRCEVWRYEGTHNGEHKVGEGCLAKGVGAWMMGMGTPMMGRRTRSNKEWDPVANLLRQGYGLLKASEERNGTMVTILEVTKIDRHAVSASAFQPPAGYSEMNLGDMMRGGPSH